MMRFWGIFFRSFVSESNILKLSFPDIMLTECIRYFNDYFCGINEFFFHESIEHLKIKSAKTFL